LQYVLENSEAKSVLTTKQYASQMEPLASKANIEMHLLENIEASGSTQQASQTLIQLAEAAAHSKEAQAQQSLDEQLAKLRHTEHDGSLIVYTSGTTGRPKGDPAFHT
jgi:long-subunit acyl-CoA synthetase (AMP-forming)